jgi:hypothetical protein
MYDSAVKRGVMKELCVVCHKPFSGWKASSKFSMTGAVTDV